MSDQISLPSSEPKPSPATLAPTNVTKTSQPVRPRLWPAIVILLLQWSAMLIPGWVDPQSMNQFKGLMFGSMIGTGCLAIWWLLLSRVPWTDRFLGLGVAALGGLGMHYVGDESFSQLGFMGLVMFSLPTVLTAFVGWLVVSSFLSWPIRRVGLVLVLLLSWGYFATVRLDGLYGNFVATIRWRWSETAEDRALAARAGQHHDAPGQRGLSYLSPGDWPAFRGAERDGRYTGPKIRTDWTEHPPKQVWRKLVGPGWGSFAVIGEQVFTQEQLGSEEVVVCYSSTTGAEVWSHKDKIRFTEPIAGAGPRATPTFYEGNIYSLGATGKLNCLTADSGKLVWSRDVAADTGAKIPQWGFSSSPLVANGLVIVFAGAEGGKTLQAYKIKTGEPAWTAGVGKEKGETLSYCSPQLSKVDGVEQILFTTGAGLTSYHPTDGKVLWDYGWHSDAARVVQPAVLDKTDIVIGSGMEAGTQRVHVTHGDNGWKVQEKWETKTISPYYNDSVIHKGYMYGFDRGLLTCNDLETGKQKWRARGYGNGQVLLLVEQELLLVLTEYGEVALVEARPEARKETGRFMALPGIDNKTWNHPVVAHGKLFVRNGSEAACFDLQLEEQTKREDSREK